MNFILFLLGSNDLPSIQHISSLPTIDIHALDSLENSSNVNSRKKSNGFFVLSDDGNVYRVKFKSISTNENDDEQQTMVVCFPPYVSICTDERKEFRFI
jgi:hypothetical protein